MKNLILLLIISVSFLMSCTQEINLSVVGGEKQIVIEGSIENGKHAKVIVTRNSPISQPINYNNLLVANAKVYVSNGIITDTLKFNYPNYDSASSVPFLYIGTSIIGAPHQTYYLTVVADGNKYTSVTTIPAPLRLDSVWWKKEPPYDSLGFAWARLSDPQGYGNCYKWYAKRATKDRRFLAPYASAFDDKFIDGKTFDFAYGRGSDPNDVATAPPAVDAGYFKNTDTVYIKFCTIDYNTCRFYETYESALDNNGNPFSSPVSIISNITGGGLGVWAGFGVTYDTIKPKH